MVDVLHLQASNVFYLHQQLALSVKPVNMAMLMKTPSACLVLIMQTLFVDKMQTQ